MSPQEPAIPFILLVALTLVLSLPATLTRRFWGLTSGRLTPFILW